MEQSAKSLALIPTIRQALEIALGASSQNIIVEDEAAATRAIEFLKKNRAGRATFLPLTTIKPRQLPDHNRTTIEKVLVSGTGFFLVSYESSLDSISNLLGTTIFLIQWSMPTAARQVSGSHGDVGWNRASDWRFLCWWCQPQ